MEISIAVKLETIQFIFVRQSKFSSKARKTAIRNNSKLTAIRNKF